jgi:hypothetical protein
MLMHAFPRHFYKQSQALSNDGRQWRRPRIRARNERGCALQEWPRSDGKQNEGAWILDFCMVRLPFQRATMPTTSVLCQWPRNEISVGLPNPPKMAPPQCTRFSPQDAQERHSSRRPAHPQACKCLCSSRHLGRSSSRGGRSGPRLCSVACPRGGYLALRLASTLHGFGASMSPVSTAKVSWGNRAWQERSPAMLPALSESSAMWSGGFKRAGRCAASCRSGFAPSPCFKLRSRVSGGGERKVKRF